MKILAINASHTGEKGYTQFLIDKIFQGARRSGAECESVALSSIKITPCRGCLVCQTEKHFLKCIYDDKDDVKSVFDRMRKADIIIFATPVYIFSMTGLLKIFLDRINSTANKAEFRVSKSGLFFHHIDSDLCSKPFVTLVCCNNLEDETPRNVISYFETYSKFMDAPRVGLLVRNGGELTGHGKDPEKEKMYPRIFQVYEAYVEAGEELAKTGRISRATQRKADQEVIPVPFFKYIKRLKIAKPMMAKKAKEAAGK
jgi:multimeric flavodoxin WrbA